MEREKMIERLKQAHQDNEKVTLVVKTGKHQTMEVPLSKGFDKEYVGEKYSFWELSLEDWKADEVVKRVKDTDTMCNQVEYTERYLMDNIENILVSVGN